MKSHYLIRFILLTVISVGSGCARSGAWVTRPAPDGVPQPDRVVVYDFAVSPYHVHLDSAPGALLMQGSAGRTQSQQELFVGRKVADALSRNLVAELKANGIMAYRAAADVPISQNTLLLAGQFLRIDQGSRARRVMVGFGLGQTELRTQVQAIQGGVTIAEGVTKATSGLKPGMLPNVGVGAAAGRAGQATAVGGGGAAVSELFIATVEGDARRTAVKIAIRIVEGFKKRGWLR